MWPLLLFNRCELAVTCNVALFTQVPRSMEFSEVRNAKQRQKSFM
jgi:hypothetical protein